MKRSIIATTLALCVGCATGVAVRDVIVPARAQGQTGPNYEYDAVVVLESYWENVEKRKEVLSKYGHEGWRLVSANAVGGASLATALYFERQLPPR